MSNTNVQVEYSNKKNAAVYCGLYCAFAFGVWAEVFDSPNFFIGALVGGSISYLAASHRIPSGIFCAVVASLFLLGAVNENSQLLAQPPYQFKVSNNCKHPIEVAVVYYGAGGNWERRGYFRFASGERSFLSAGGNKILLNGRVYYYYARSTDGSNLSWAGEHNIVVNGENLLMKQVEAPPGEVNLKLSCS